MLRSAAPILLLLALTGSASAIDPSGMEETNCLQACDANQEHCLSAERPAAGRTYRRAEYSSVPEMKSLPRIRSVRTIGLPETHDVARLGRQEQR
jgi:hypothetical protein